MALRFPQFCALANRHGTTMQAGAFIADANALQAELSNLAPVVGQMLANLLDLVDLQNGNIATLLDTNKKLLDTIDALRG